MATVRINRRNVKAKHTNLGKLLPVGLRRRGRWVGPTGPFGRLECGREEAGMVQGLRFLR